MLAGIQRVVLTLGLSLIGPLVMAQLVQVKLVNGKVLQGTLLGLQDECLNLLLPVTGKQSFARECIQCLIWPQQKMSVMAEQAAVYLRGGEVLRGTLQRISSQKIILQSDCWGPLGVPYACLQAICFTGRCPSLPDERLVDWVFLRAQPGTPLAGVIQSLQPGTVRFHWELDDQVHCISFRKIRALCWAPLDDSVTLTDYAVVRTTDGSCLHATRLELSKQRCRLDTSWQRGLECCGDKLASIELQPKAWLFLSDLEPVKVEQRSFFGEALWRFQKDRDSYGRPLRIGTQTFPKGLGVHAYCALTFDLKRRYRQMRATIGLSAWASVDGQVIFRVLGDRRCLFESKTIQAGSPGQPIIVGVQDIKFLTLIVDFGENLDLGDQAVWGAVGVRQ